MSERISEANCGQLNGIASCEGCPLYTEARGIIEESSSNAPLVLQLRGYCPKGVQMDIKSLGLKEPKEVRPLPTLPRPKQSIW